MTAGGFVVSWPIGSRSPGMDLDALLDAPGPREPLLTTGEAHAALALLRPIADSDGPDAPAAEELIVRLAQRVPAPIRI